VSLGFTAFYVGKAMRAAGTRGANSFMPEMGPEAIFWCLALLVPLAAFFSAVCLGLALFARSTKEGQYFLMPVTLVTMPLTLLSILPGVNLKEHPVYAILPITGPTLLMQSLMNMKTLDPTIVLHFFAVILPLIAYCYLALHWAVAQFNSEEVLFREAERLDLKLWLHRLLREKEALPSASMAMSCFALIMLIRWFLLTNSSPNDNILRTTAAGLLVGIALPPLMMAFMLTMRPDHSLLLRSPRWYWFFFGIVFAVLLHPVVTTVVNFALQQAPTIKEQVRPYEEKLFNSGFGLPAMLFTFALLPAVCEELAFRGFVLMGLLRRLGTGKAVLVSSLLFAIAHLTAFQFLPTFLIGLLLGYLALRSGSVYPGMILHALHNGLVFAVGFYIKQSGGEDLGFDDPLRPIYTWPVLTICSIIGLFLGYLLLFRAPDSVSVLIEENQDTVDCPSLG
jgi:sodium transport system permease protein